MWQCSWCLSTNSNDSISIPMSVKDDWIGLAGIVSKDELLLQIKKFSNSFGMNGTAAQGYFGLDTTTSLMQSKAIVASTLLPKGEHRTYSQAEILMKATVQAFGAKAAKQTRYIKAINYCISQYGLIESVRLLTILKLTRNLNWMLPNVRIKFNAFKELSLSRFIHCTKIPTIIN